MRKLLVIVVALPAILVLFGRSPALAQERLVNGGFEDGLSGWDPFWARSAGSGSAAPDRDRPYQGVASLRIEHRGESDWSVGQSGSIPVRPGEIYVYRGWARKAGAGGAAEISVVLRDAAGGVIDWSYGRRPIPDGDWRQVRARFMIPPNGATITPRVIGSGPASLNVDDLSLERTTGSAKALPPAAAPVDIASDRLEVRLESSNGTLRVRDLRGGRTWEQRPAGPSLVVREARRADGRIEATLIHPESAQEIGIQVRAVPGQAEVEVELTGYGDLDSEIAYPYPFVSPAASFLIMPVNEGMSYPVDDSTLPEMWYHLAGGHGLCMAWWGVTDGKAGMMAIVETPDDAAVRTPRIDRRFTLAPLWRPQKGAFGPARKLRYVFLDDGGYVAMAKRYREYARQAGLLRTLADKKEKNPNVDRLVGAVNVWCWDDDAVGIVREMQSAGIDRILWSNGVKPDTLRTLNGLGVLTSRYDIFQDVMDPANFKAIGYQHPDWTTRAWPADLVLDAGGRWVHGWGVDAKDGKRYDCGVTCDRPAIRYAAERIEADLKTHPYLCRFIDTTTASEWRECYSPAHPMTRSDSRRWRMELLRLISERYHLVTGSETGHDAAVPYVHYFEGMLSLGPYRIHEAGRDMDRIVSDVPRQIETFQVGAYYRLPLWELVYHDCVVAQWYWGDYNNKLPAVWDRRDLFNALYGTPPMFMFKRGLWEKERDRFVRSYRTTAPIARATGYSEMLSHRWLTADHRVQETRFANGAVVVVNLGTGEAALDDGSKLPALGIRVQGIPSEDRAAR
ncbi:glycoside hydrolase [Aquisphaera insulae]|uniref:glycoside hydrolase n=1 Tax=Aquisphaera insulae TaxID=2712864 RepID=UPI0013EAD49D|nr:glycoside hydrolase [Aquisphaera insulae]